MVTRVNEDNPLNIGPTQNLHMLLRADKKIKIIRELAPIHFLIHNS